MRSITEGRHGEGRGEMECIFVGWVSYRQPNTPIINHQYSTPHRFCIIKHFCIRG
jgi:hypothetical protein